jgi:hypothetical protein
MIKCFKRNLKVRNDYIKKRGKTCRCEMGERGRSSVVVNKKVSSGTPGARVPRLCSSNLIHLLCLYLIVSQTSGLLNFVA